MRARSTILAASCSILLACNGVALPPRSDGSTPQPSGCGKLTCSVPPGALLVSEVLYDPAGEDSGREWFELYNASGAKIPTLAGVVLEVWSNSTGPDKGKSLVIQETGAPALEVGGFVVVGPGQSNDAGAAAPVGVKWSSMPALNNTAGSTIRAKCCDGTELAKLSYTGAAPWPKPASGVAIQLSQSVLERGTPPDAASAVDPGNWCRADDAPDYDGAGNKGTPGAKNGSCAVAGECRDGASSRAIRTPAAGELKITEVLPNPAGVDDYKEWVELQAQADVDLNDLVLVHTNPSNNSRKSAISSPDCLQVGAGQFVLLGSSANATDAAAPDYNGGVKGVTYVLRDKQFLYNDAGTLALQTADGTVIDSAQHPKAKDGIAVCLDPASGVWGDATDSGQFDGTGTPGNGTCTHAPAP